MAYDYGAKDTNVAMGGIYYLLCGILFFSGTSSAFVGAGPEPHPEPEL
jgi:hypothetical protein